MNYWVFKGAGYGDLLPSRSIIRARINRAPRQDPKNHVKNLEILEQWF
jgi:hypothetical protein